jgi:hypothetical protein
MSRTKENVAERRPSNSANERLARIEAASSPWWASIPDTGAKCAKVAIFPLKAITLAADAAVSLSFVVIGGSVAMWWFGYIADATVSAFLGKVGERALAIVRSSGLI